MAQPTNAAPLPATAHPVQLLAQVDLYLLLTDFYDDESDVHDEHIRLLRLLTLARKVPMGQFWCQRDIEGLSPEAARDELDQRLASIDLAPWNLPASAVVQRVPRAHSGLGIVKDPLLALALVSRVSGGLFLARRSPHQDPLMEPDVSFRFFAAPAAVAATRGVRP